MEESLEKAAFDIIDSWVEDLIGKLLSAGSEGSQRGLWDRFKGGLYNLFLGRTGSLAQKYNPYYSRNKYGDDLGAKEESALTLSDYNKIKTAIVYAESYVEKNLLLTESDSNKLKFVVMIRQAAKELKQKLIPLLSRYSAIAKDSEVGAVEPAAIENPETDTERAATGGAIEPAAIENPEVDTERAAKKKSTDVPPKARSTTPTARSNPAARAYKDKEKAAEKRSESTPTTSSTTTSTSQTSRSFTEVMKDTLLHSPEPNPDWVSEGKLVPDQLPAIVAWVSKNLSADISDDRKVEDKLKQKFPDFVGLNRYEDGNSLLKAFFEKGSIGGIGREFLGQKLVKELGVDEKAVISAMGEKKKASPSSEKRDDEPSSEGPPVKASPRTLEEIFGKAKNREEVLESVYKQVVSKVKEIVKGNKNKGAFERSWSRYVKNAASFNLEELKKAIKSDLAKTISSWEFDGVDEKVVNQIIAGI